ncbi:MAG: 7-carboxy-7-deazaguanine synthase QueE [Halobacteria archaeon]
MTEQKPSLAISEMFYSVQGEGPYAGIPSIFLRLTGCNLCCGGRENIKRPESEMKPEDDATWVCDTIAVWRQAAYTMPAEELIKDWNARGWLNKLPESHIVLTGGEPTLKRHQKGFTAFMRELEEGTVYTGDMPLVECETNGTKVPTATFSRLINHFNVSLKLSNSGMDTGTRINEDAIKFFISFNSQMGNGAVFKFVTDGRDEDVEEIEDIVNAYSIPREMLTLMPAGQTREDMRETYPKVAEICKKRNWRFTPRLQVDTWGETTGV